MVLAEPVCDDYRGLAPDPSSVRVLVLTVQCDRRRVVVKLLEIDLELAHHVDDEVREQGAPVGIEQPVQRSPKPISASPWEVVLTLPWKQEAL